MPPGQLPLEELHAVADLDRRPREKLRIGSTRRLLRAVRVHARSGERRGAEALAHQLRDLGSTGHRLGIREVERGPAEALADQAGGPVELLGRLGRGDPIEQPVAVRVRADVDEPGRAGVAQRRPRHRPPAVGKVDTVFDERRRGVERGAHAVPHEDRQRDVDEVGGAVVERDDHRPASSPQSPSTGRSAGASSRSSAAPSDNARFDAATAAICSSNRPGSRSISSDDPPPTRW